MLVQFDLGKQAFFFEEPGSGPRRGSALDHFESGPIKADKTSLILDGSQAVKLKPPDDSRSTDPSGYVTQISTAFHTSPMIYNMQGFTASIWVKPEGEDTDSVAVSQRFQFEIGVEKN